MFYLHVEILHRGYFGLTNALYKRCPFRFKDIPSPDLRVAFAWPPRYHQLVTIFFFNCKIRKVFFGILHSANIFLKVWIPLNIFIYFTFHNQQVKFSTHRNLNLSFMMKDVIMYNYELCTRILPPNLIVTFKLMK